MLATLNIAGDNAGTKKWCSALSMPIAAAARAMKARNGSMIRVSSTVRCIFADSRRSRPVTNA